MSDYRLVVAVSNPASVDQLTRIGSTLARANDGSLIITSVVELPAQIPVRADHNDIGSQQEAIVERALSIAESVGVPAEGKAPPSHRPVRSIVSLVEDTDAAGPLVGSDERIPFEESLFGRTNLEQIIEQVPCDVYVEQIRPSPAVLGDSVLVPVAAGPHAETVMDVAADIGRACDMRVHLVTVVSPSADVHTIEQTEQRLRTCLNTGIDTDRCNHLRQSGRPVEGPRPETFVPFQHGGKELQRSVSVNKRDRRKPHTEFSLSILHAIPGRCS